MTFNYSEESISSIKKATKEAFELMQEKKADFNETFNIEECNGVVYYPEECVVHFYKGKTFMYEFNAAPIGTVNPHSQIFRWIWSHPIATELEIETSEKLASLGDCISPLFTEESFPVEPDVLVALIALSVDYLGALGFVNVNLRDTPYYVGIFEFNPEPVVDPY